MQKEVYQAIAKQTGDQILEWKSCKQCRAQFPITQNDQELLKKIAPVVAGEKQYFSIPEFCPDCRARQRLIRRNESNFYNSKSALTGKKLFSLFSPAADVEVVSLEEFWSDEFNNIIVEQDIDVKSSILSQVNTLRSKIPTQNTMTIDNENCHYTTGTGYCKNCYLINSSENSEDCMYGKLFQTCKSCLDCSYIYDSEKLYQCVNVKKGYNSMRLNNSQDCSSCYFSDDLIGCQNCMFCSGLRNAQYCFENKQLSKQEREQKTKLFLGSNENIQSGLKKFQEVKKNKISKYANIIHSEKSFGDFQTDNKNCISCYDTNGSQDCKYVSVGVEIKDIVDGNNIYLNPEKCYNNIGIMHVHDVHFCIYVFDSHSLILCQECHNSDNLFGCVGLKNKQYCIFNKQYTKEQYEQLVPKIIQKMKQEGEWGFFSPSAAHYPYNDSLAMEYFPVREIKNVKTGEIKIIDKNGQGTVILFDTDAEISNAILDLGGEYKMPIKRKTKEKEINIPDGIKIIDSKDSNNLSNDEILKVAFSCETSGRPYKILKQELEFYADMGLPLPTKHPDIRYKERLQQKPKRELHTASCGKCGVDMITVYPDNHKYIYCQKCYNSEIY